MQYKLSLFLVYGQAPPIHLPYVPRESNVERTLQAGEQTIQMLKFHLKRAQGRIVYKPNKKWTDRQFDVGMWVYVMLQPHKQVSVIQRSQHKLFANSYEPF